MIHTKILGASSFIIVIIFLISCSSVKNIRKEVLILEDEYNYYVIDSLNFSYRLFGNYDRVTYKKIRNNVREICKNLSERNCIDCFKTFSNPTWHDAMHCSFYFQNTKPTQHNKLLNAIKKESISFYLDTNRCVIGKFIPLEKNKGEIYIIGRSGKEGLSSMVSNYTNIFASIVTNEKYRNITFTPPFELGREHEFYEDTTVNFLMPVFILKRREANYSDMYSKFNWQQSYGTFLSRITSEQKEIKKYSNRLSESIEKDDFASTENNMLKNDAALSYLIRKCKDEQVVMINENHFAFKHRILGELFLDSLYNFGFRYFAIEAIWENDTALNERGFAVTNTGFYTREPMMANLIRKAIEKGYYVCGYDDFTNDREKNQATNIYQKTIAKDSLCKVLVWAGFDHINEAESSRNWMAREFLLLTGIDPLTINQTNYVTDEDCYLLVLDTTALKNRKISCDIFVANNLNYEWLAAKSGSKNYEISIPREIKRKAKANPLMFATKGGNKNNVPKKIARNAKKESLTFMVSIFKADEYQKDKTAIPVYNHILNNNMSKISLKLPESEYIYIIRHRYGKILYQSNL
jgi:hypothetical protein